MKKSVKNKELNSQKKVSEKFIIALAIVSISGFVGIISKSIFSYNLDGHVDAVMMLVVGVALLIDADYKVLKTLKYGLTSENFSHLTLAVIGVLALLAGIFTIPQIAIEHSLFLSIKGIISIIAIIVIIVQTWFSKN